MKDIQSEAQKIHAQYGITEKANYMIQLLCEQYTTYYATQRVAEQTVSEEPSSLPPAGEGMAYNGSGL